MKELIGLYTHILFTSMSFIILSCALLVPFYYPAIENSKKRHQQILETLRINLSAILMGGQHFSNRLNYSIIKMNKLIAENKTILRKLNAKRQASRILLSLIGSVVFVGIYYIQDYSFLNLDPGILKYGSILISLLFLSYALVINWQLFQTILWIQSEQTYNYE